MLKSSMMGVRKKIITEKEKLEIILKKATIAHLSMQDTDGYSYTVPMNFGFQDNCFFFHSGPGGKKLALLEKNPKVSISVSFDEELFVRHDHVACSYSMLYKSVVAKGKAVFVEDAHEKTLCLNSIMRQYSERDDFSYNAPALNNVIVFKVDCEEICGHSRENS
jgi:nitroimidazol reductase NimA-like FMN-containing flavoprotein (pyridoxamine 5'-phosphate oxidase superfamily)